MSEITILDKNTIDKIAAGEVVERPSSVVKELCENAIDAKATAISIEIKDGGAKLIRITDNGTGIEKSQIDKAFLRHSTSKIKTADDLSFIKTLGFRGEALSSISAVSRLELCTKTKDDMTGVIYKIEGGNKVDETEAGLPDGTTIIVRDLFYNTPARLKFLKTAQTEGSYIADIVEKTALSHPDISFKFVSNGTTKLLTSGNGSLKDAIYAIYGKYAASNILPVDAGNDFLSVQGFVGKPEFSRGNRNYEIYFINNRYVKDKIVARAIEEAYKGYMMKGSFPFTVLNISIEPELIDVNVHPAKMEIRFFDNEKVFNSIKNILLPVITVRESIPDAGVEYKDVFKPAPVTGKTYEPFENKGNSGYVQKETTDASKKTYGNVQKDYSLTNVNNKTASLGDKNESNSDRIDKSLNQQSELNHTISKNGFANINVESGNPQHNQFYHSSSNIIKDNDFIYDKNNLSVDNNSFINHGVSEDNCESDYALKHIADKTDKSANNADSKIIFEEPQPIVEDSQIGKQAELFDENFLSESARPKHRIVGEVFDTYWIVEFEDKMFIIDQHAAHEKVLYEQMLANVKNSKHYSQKIMPAIIITLSQSEEDVVNKFKKQFEELGFEIEHFGGKEYAVNAVPADLYSLDNKQLLISLLDELTDIGIHASYEMITDRVAMASCKAAVKGGNKLSYAEAESLIDKLLTLENPYNCPHGRPTIISMSRAELEKKFKRIV